MFSLVWFKGEKIKLNLLVTFGRLYVASETRIGDCDTEKGVYKFIWTRVRFPPPPPKTLIKLGKSFI